jgi:hypothetical protein
VFPKGKCGSEIEFMKAWRKMWYVRGINMDSNSSSVFRSFNLIIF